MNRSTHPQKAPWFALSLLWPFASFAQMQLGIQGGLPPLISVSGPANSACQIQWSEGFSGKESWHHLGSMVLTGSPTFIPDPTWAQSTSRFYRAVETPAVDMVFIPPGSFVMGDSIGDGELDEQPTNLVFISGFFIDQYEVTNEKMRKVMQWAYDNGMVVASSAGVTNIHGTAHRLLDLTGPGAALSFSGSTFAVSPGKSNYPCVFVTWYGAAAYCNYRSELEGKAACYDFSDWSCDLTGSGYRLPTEAEWEKAARGGLEGRRYPWGDNINPNLANWGPNGAVSQVGSYPANGYGLYDSAGNVWEWCWDYYDFSYYTNMPMVDPKGPSTSAWKSPRGGSWYAPAEDSRVANRLEQVEPSFGFVDAGFRAVQSIQTTELPKLKIALVDPEQMMISWSPDSAGWILQECSDLPSANWTNSPSLSTNPVTIRVSELFKVYRLRRQ